MGRRPLLKNINVIEIRLGTGELNGSMTTSLEYRIDPDTFQSVAPRLWHLILKNAPTKDEWNISNVAICLSDEERP